jgi:hypothetical protein
MPEYNLYRYGADGKLEGAIQTHSDTDIDVSLYMPPIRHTFIEPPAYEQATQIPVWNGVAWIVRELSEYAPKLEDVKAAKCDEIKAASESALASGYTMSNGIKGNCGLEDVVMLRGGIELVEAAGGTELTEYRDFNNQRHFNVPIATARTMLVELMLWQAGIFHKKWELQDQIKAAETIEAAEAVNW